MSLASEWPMLQRYGTLSNCQYQINYENSLNKINVMNANRNFESLLWLFSGKEKGRKLGEDDFKATSYESIGKCKYK